jgi:hypothetical protein
MSREYVQGDTAYHMARQRGPWSVRAISVVILVALSGMKEVGAMLEVDCPHCGRTLRIPEHCAGKTGFCNHCNGQFVAPAMAEVNWSPPTAVPQPTKRELPPIIAPILRVSATIGVLCGVVLVLAAIGWNRPTERERNAREEQARKAAEAEAAADAAYQAKIKAHLESLASLADFNRIQNGMSYAQVVEIVGSEGTLVLSTHVDGIPGITEAVDRETYGWDGNGGSGTYMKAVFKNGELVGRIQSGLH